MPVWCLQRMEYHREGQNWEPPVEGVDLDLQQRVYVRMEPRCFVGFSPEELAV